MARRVSRSPRRPRGPRRVLLAIAAIGLAAVAAMFSPPVAKFWRQSEQVPAARQASAEPTAAPPAKSAGAPARPGAERYRDAAEYQYLQAELQLAATGKPYAVFIWETQPRAEVRLKGATVAALPMRVEGGEEAVRRFRDRFRGPQRRVLRGILQKYLYMAQDQTPDSVLTIVGNVLNMDPEVLQRHLPEWFELKWRNDLVLEVRADVKGKPVEGVDLRIVRLQQTLRRPFGEVRLRVHMDRADALTLYRLAGPGFPTLSRLP